MARISELGYGCTGAALKIRILCKWIHYYRSNETWFLAVDTYGDSIQILGKRPNQHLLESKLRLFRCYEIEYYTCTETRPYAKTIPSSVHLNLGLASKITEIEDDDSLPRTWFNFATIDQIQTTPPNPNEFTDVIGCFKGIRLLHKTTGERFVRLDLTHESGRTINNTLWNECVDDQEKFDPDILNTTSTKTVFAITALKISESGGQPNLKSTAATHVYGNPVIPETELLLQRMETHSLLTPNVNLIPVTVKELKIMSYSAARGKTFAVRSTMDCFTFNEGWFSAFCPSCDTPIPKKGNDWFCVTHGKPRTVTYRFTLSATFNDTTDMFLMLLSDDTVKKMCNTSCNSLVIESGYDDMRQLPAIIDRCRFGTYIFHIQMTTWSKSDNISFVAMDVQNKTNLPQEESSLLLTPPSSHKETPTSVSKPLMIHSSDTINSTRKQIIYEDDDKIEDVKSTGKRKELVLEDEDELDVINPTKKERFPNLLMPLISAFII